MNPNFYIVFLTGLIPLFVGAIYYHPKVVGNAWMKVKKFVEKDLEGANMPLIFLVSYVLGVMISFAMIGFAVHQSALYSLLMADPVPGSEEMFNEVMDQFGHRYMTFKHGAAHGLMATVFFALPIIATNALFERRGWKYIGIHIGYWAITLVLIGGFLCLYFY